MAEELVLQSRVRGRDHGRRLLDLLAERFTYHSAKKWLAIVESGELLVNGSRSAADRELAEGDILRYTMADFVEPPVDTSFLVVHESREFILVAKPAGTPVTRSGLIVKNTLVNLVRRAYGSDDIHPLHRIDRETSGLVLFGRNKEVCRRYQGDLASLILDKYYLAVVQGVFPHDSIRVDVPLGTRATSEIRCRMWPGTGRACRTLFHCLGRGRDRSLLLAELKTGRRHQIRAHLAHLGHPLVADKIYAHGGRYFLRKIETGLSEEDYSALGAHNHLLHAWALRLAGEGFFQADSFPAEMALALKAFPDWRERAVTIAGNGADAALCALA